ncbi:FeoA family protein [Bordetella sp. LUAb4]|uniref:FeoA family protein n=1 Tax=Bordetella sp. LUAb4 TaxID=2843195 RepID=UPI001E5A54B4|nr:FeoA family protein [Bordetella sp. LUAb4]
MTSLRLSELATHDHAVVEQVIDLRSPDPIAARLRDLGFVAGEPVRIAAKAPFGGDPLLIAIGTTRFALRRNEAERVLVTRTVNDAGKHGGSEHEGDQQREDRHQNDKHQRDKTPGDKHA